MEGWRKDRIIKIIEEDQRLSLRKEETGKSAAQKELEREHMRVTGILAVIHAIVCWNTWVCLFVYSNLWWWDLSPSICCS